jgi:hypothetical protein
VNVPVPPQDDGTISPSGRFARMEAALDRIEHKLDLKADTARVEALEIVVDGLQKNFNDALSGRTISPQAQDYIRRFAEMERSIDQLEQSDSNKVAVAQAIKDTADVRYRSLLWVVGIVSLLNMAIAIASALLRPV